MRDTLEIVIDISNIIQDKSNITGKDYKELIEELKKECLGVDQNNQSTNKIMFNDILPLETGIDNGKLYDKIIGKTIKEF